jgi:hypothetical protein
VENFENNLSIEERSGGEMEKNSKSGIEYKRGKREEHLVWKNISVE